MDVPSALVVLLGWTALSCVVVVPVCLLLRGAAVLEQRARQSQQRQSQQRQSQQRRDQQRRDQQRRSRPDGPAPRARARSVRWCVHRPATTAVRRVRVRGR